MRLQRSKYNCPASVSSILRVVRCKSLSPISFSRPLIRRDSVEFGIPIASAARRKLRAFTTSTNSAMSLRYSNVIAPPVDQSILFYRVYPEFGLINDSHIVY